MKTIEEALASIPGRRDALNHIDDQLSDVIRHVERALASLHPGVPAETEYQTEDGAFVIAFLRFKGNWRIMRGAQDDPQYDIPLESANRQVRAEVFTVDGEGRTPIERLIIEVAASLEEVAQERSPQLDAARRIAAALVAAGYPLHG